MTHVKYDVYLPYNKVQVIILTGFYLKDIKNI